MGIRKVALAGLALSSILLFAPEAGATQRRGGVYVSGGYRTGRYYGGPRYYGRGYYGGYYGRGYYGGYYGRGYYGSYYRPGFYVGYSSPGFGVGYGYGYRAPYYYPQQTFVPIAPYPVYPAYGYGYYRAPYCRW